MPITPKRDFAHALTEFFTGELDKRLAPPLKQLAELIQKVNEQLALQAEVVKVTKIDAPKSNGVAKAKRRGRPPKVQAAVRKGPRGSRPGAPAFAIPEGKWEEVAKLRAEGWTGIALAKKYKTTPATVYNTVNRYNAEQAQS